MARSHAKVLVQVWRDPEWVALPSDAKLLYVLLLTQPKLTLVGSLEVTVGRWASSSPDWSTESVEIALATLEDARKVLVDRSTDELLIRSFTKNDLDPNRLNMNLAKGLWGHWSAIESADLRSAALRYMPDDVWEKLADHAPSDAAYIRRSAQLEPVVPTERPNQASEPPPSSLLPTDTGHRPAEEPLPAPSVDNVTPLRGRLAQLEASPPQWGAQARGGDGLVHVNGQAMAVGVEGERDAHDA